MSKRDMYSSKRNATCVSENEQAVTPVTPPVTPPVEKECASAQPATTFDATTTQSASEQFPSGTCSMSGQTWREQSATISPLAQLRIPPGGSAVTGLTLRIDNSDSSGRCPAGGVTATVDSGIPPRRIPYWRYRLYNGLSDLGNE